MTQSSKRRVVFSKMGYTASLLQLGKSEFMLNVFKSGYLLLSQTFEKNVVEIRFPEQGYFVVLLEDLTTVVFNLAATPGQQEMLRFRARSGARLEFKTTEHELVEFSITGIVPAVNGHPWYTQIPKPKKERQA